MYEVTEDVLLYRVIAGGTEITCFHASNVPSVCPAYAKSSIDERIALRAAMEPRVKHILPVRRIRVINTDIPQVAVVGEVDTRINPILRGLVDF